VISLFFKNSVIILFIKLILDTCETTLYNYIFYLSDRVMAIRQINTDILNQVKLDRLNRVPTLLSNKPCNSLKGLSTSKESLESAANAGKKIAELFS